MPWPETHWLSGGIYLLYYYIRIVHSEAIWLWLSLPLLSLCVWNFNFLCSVLVANQQQCPPEAVTGQQETCYIASFPDGFNDDSTDEICQYVSLFWIIQGVPKNCTKFVMQLFMNCLSLGCDVCTNIHCEPKKTWQYICDHNSGKTHSIFIIFALM